MYKKEIEAYIEAHKEEMIQDIFTLCRSTVRKCLTKKANHMEKARRWH